MALKLALPQPENEVPALVFETNRYVPYTDYSGFQHINFVREGEAYAQSTPLFPVMPNEGLLDSIFSKKMSGCTPKAGGYKFPSFCTSSMSSRAAIEPERGSIEPEKTMPGEGQASTAKAAPTYTRLPGQGKVPRQFIPHLFACK